MPVEIRPITADNFRDVLDLEVTQRRGHGRAAMLAIMDYPRASEGATSFGLSYAPDNAVARRLYASPGFVETREREDNDVDARLAPGDLQRSREPCLKD